jgi:AraC-like DNA-binding protein
MVTRSFIRDLRRLSRITGSSQRVLKELLGQTPLEYVTEWRMQNAMQLPRQRHKKLIDVARLVGYESEAGFSKAFK